MKNWRMLILGVAITANTAFAAPQMVDKVAAVVNNGVVLESDNMLRTVKSQAQQAGQQLPDDKTLRHQILNAGSWMPSFCRWAKKPVCR